LKSLLRKVVLSGAHEAGPRSKVRSIQLTNAIALITASLFITLLTYMIVRSGWTVAAQVGLCTVAILLGVVILNRWGWYNLARGLMCIIIPLAVLAAIFLPRLSLIGQYNHFRSPEIYSIFITSAIIPLLIFSLRERVALWSGLLFNIVILLLFDFGLYRFSNANAQAPYTILRFVGSHFVVVIMYLFLAGSIAFLKDLFEYFEAKNDRLIIQLNQRNQELHNSNQELHELNQEIEVQNEEIKSQSEELQQSQESIMHANVEIERQKRELEEKNHLLETSLGEKNLDLLLTNQQLINQNSDLQQFSFTVSHNLRAPVASMKGLINLYYLAETDNERIKVMRLFENATTSLDTIVQDLGKVVDIRHNNFSALENVRLQTEVNLIVQSLSAFISSNEVSIQTDFAAPQLMSIKAYINSVLFNLISNAIQYRSPVRRPVIQISSRQNAEHIIIEVSDNGLGMDLQKHRSDLFKLYKRFHSHTPGKGFGLFIVKQQLEKLNAKIEVESVPDKGTTFRIFHQNNLSL
jgi:signal transduction histidine kinase